MVNKENFFSIVNFLEEMDYSIYLIDDTNFKIQILNLDNKNYIDKNYKNILCLFNKNLKTGGIPKPVHAPAEVVLDDVTYGQVPKSISNNET